MKKKLTRVKAVTKAAKDPLWQLKIDSYLANLLYSNMFVIADITFVPDFVWTIYYTLVYFKCGLTMRISLYPCR